MSLSAGWFLLAGGVLSAFRCATAKKFYKSDFANKVDINIPEEDHQAEVRVDRRGRSLLVALGFVVAAVGALLIQRAHNWIPFSH